MYFNEIRQYIYVYKKKVLVFPSVVSVFSVFSVVNVFFLNVFSVVFLIVFSYCKKIKERLCV